MLGRITPLILTFNEAPNIERTLNHLRWAKEIVVVDSYSTDETERIVRRFSNVTFVQRAFDDFASQCNFGLTQIETEWVLSLDADYLMTEDLCDEVSRLIPEPDVSAYDSRFQYQIAGRRLRGSLYPPRPVLFRKLKGHYVQDGHAHRLVFEGSTRRLRGFLVHDDRKPLTRWLQSQISYAQQEAERLISHPGPPRSAADRLRQWILPAAPATFLYSLLVKRCLFDGWPGWSYALQRTCFEVLLSLELLDRRLFNGRDGTKEAKTP